ncbi:unnamed protein product [Paramecium octaurelia]|uniref:Uncharacterized protein n=1 Tax=Paramecium octaurelia TaxID=43137 RepID=A0A8S1XQD6_PAROT|nr:unnamed protein product [Paramecium octaurelia]
MMRFIYNQQQKQEINCKGRLDLGVNIRFQYIVRMTQQYFKTKLLIEDMKQNNNIGMRLIDIGQQIKQ